MSPPSEHDQSLVSLDGETPEDKSLVLAFQAGDGSAYDEIYGRYADRVKGICRRMLIDPHDVQEASQEAFLRVYQALGRFNGRYELGAWIARITTNVCLDNIRGRNRRPNAFAPLEALDLEMDHEGPETPEAVTIRRAEGRRVRKVLASLPPMHRAAIVLRDFEGLSYGEIAGALHITEAQVKALLHRARQRFKRDWSSIASIFIPVRLLQRLRGVPPASVEGGAAYGSASAPQLATTCSAVLQHCGQFFAEKVGPAFIAIGVGAAGIAGATTASDTPARVEVVEANAAHVTGKLPAEAGRADKDLRSNRNTGKEKVVEEGAATVQPAPEASPTTTPSGEPTPPADEGGSPQQGTQPPGHSNGGAVPATPPPFSPALGFGTPRASPARSNFAQIDCAATSVEQQLAASISHGDKMHQAELDLDGDIDDVDFDLLVYPHENGEHGADVEYAGEGTLAAISRSESRLLLEYSGTYENTDAPDAKWKELPEAGSFRMKLELDCANSSVITETLQLSTG